MKSLIVHAHPEPASFNAALRDVAARTLAQRGHEVMVSDLYADGFKAVVDRADFGSPHDAAFFNVSLEQRHALGAGSLAADIRRELDRLLAADLLILQFPLWWFSVPAILKGWIDRVFLSGAVYGRSAMFETGKLRGKTAQLCVTTGAPASSFGPGSLHGPMDELLAPIQRGVLGFTGMRVLPAFCLHHVPYAGAQGRAEMLLAWERRLRSLDEVAPLPMPTVAAHEASLAATRDAKAR